MAENLFCDELDCGLLACAFAFVNQGKRRACESHLPNLSQKGVAIYSIQAFSFFDSPHDSSEYHKRKERKERGLEIVTSLETACQKDWEEGLSHLQEACNAVHASVQLSFEDMHTQGLQRYEETMKCLSELREHLERLVVDKGFSLSPQDSALCTAVPTGPLFKLIMGDCRQAISLMLQENYHLQAWDMNLESQAAWANKLQKYAYEQEQIGRVDIAAQIAKSARELLSAEEPVSEQPILPAYPADHPECLQAAQISCQIGDFDNALTEVKRGRDLVNDLELYVRLSNCMAEIYSQAGRWQEVAMLCEETLNTGLNASNSELLQAVYYLAEAHYQSKTSIQGITLAKKWINQLLADDPRSNSLLLCIQASMSRIQGGNKDAEELYEAAISLDGSSSYITTCCRRELGTVYELQGKFTEAEQAFMTACDRFAGNYPKSTAFAECLCDFGLLYTRNDRAKEGKKLLKQSQALSTLLPPCLKSSLCTYTLGNFYYKAAKWSKSKANYKSALIYFSSLPHSQLFADCLTGLGLVYYETQSLEKAENAYMRAYEVYTQLPLSLMAANCSYNIGLLYYRLKRLEMAVERYEQAAGMYVQFSPTPEYANCIYNTGIAYKDMKKLEKAEGKFLQAGEVYRKFPSSIDYANCMTNLGLLYMSGKRMEKAEEQFKLAIDVFTRFPLSIGYANCLNNFGLLYFKWQKWSQAEGKYLQAEEVYSHFPVCEDSANCYTNLGLLYFTIRNMEKAAEQYSLGIAIFSQFPTSKHYPKSLLTQGLLYQSMKKGKEAKKAYKLAIALLVPNRPNSKLLAKALLNLGKLYKRAEKTLKSEATLLKSKAILTAYFPLSHHSAKCLTELGSLYLGINRREEAELHCKEAESRFSARFPLSGDYANCLFTLGEVAKASGKREEAVKRYTAARQIYAHFRNIANVQKCDQVLSQISG